MTKPLSPAAQAVLDATYEEMDYALPRRVRWAAAAALRSAANHLTDATSSHTLHAIADELEGITYGTYRCHLKAQ